MLLFTYNNQIENNNKSYLKYSPIHNMQHNFQWLKLFLQRNQIKRCFPRKKPASQTCLTAGADSIYTAHKIYITDNFLWHIGVHIVYTQDYIFKWKVQRFIFESFLCNAFILLLLLNLFGWRKKLST